MNEKFFSETTKFEALLGELEKYSEVFDSIVDDIEATRSESYYPISETQVMSLRICQACLVNLIEQQKTSITDLYGLCWEEGHAGLDQIQ